MRMQYSSVSDTQEGRMLHLGRLNDAGAGISENTKTFVADTSNSYFTGPIKQGNYAQGVLGGGAAAARTFLEYPDAFVAGLLGEELNYDENRFVRDTRLFCHNIITLHPLRAAASVYRMATNDLIMEVIDQGGGFDVYRGRASGKHAIEQHYASAV